MLCDHRNEIEWIIFEINDFFLYLCSLAEVQTEKCRMREKNAENQLFPTSSINSAIFSGPINNKKDTKKHFPAIWVFAVSIKHAQKQQQ